jgi:hypothetical protein
MPQPEQTVVQLRLVGQSREDVDRVLADLKLYFGRVMHVTSPPSQGRKGGWLAYAVVVLDEESGEEASGEIRQ